VPEALLGNEDFLLFLIVGLGMALGRVSLFGLSLGSSGVLFVALLAGHLGYGIGEGVGTVGLVLFVYCVGVGAGGRFFAALVDQGSALAKLSVVIVGLGAVLALAMGRLMDIPADLAVGLFAGALTSTPALAAATDFLGEAGGGVPIGYGITYPFGVIGVVLFVQLLPRVLGIDLAVAGRELDERASAGAGIVHVLVTVTNPRLQGKQIDSYGPVLALGCQITRKWHQDRAEPLHHEDRFVDGMEVLVVGRENRVEQAIEILGERSQRAFVLDTERERRDVIIGNKTFIARPLRDLKLLPNHGVVVSRVTRLGITFIPDGNTTLDANDVLTVVGAADKISAFASAIGHRSQAFDETDLLSMGAGLAIGIFLGQLTLTLPGGGELSLGLTGGPLLAGLLLGHFGRVGSIVGHIPRPTRILLQEFGLVLFLAEAGVRGGSALLETLQVYGLQLFLFGAVITLLPLLAGLVIATRVFRLNLLEALGGICGGMTSTPALGAITEKTGSQGPVVSYATAYPVALVLMTVSAKALTQLLQALAG